MRGETCLHKRVPWGEGWLLRCLGLLRRGAFGGLGTLNVGEKRGWVCVIWWVGQAGNGSVISCVGW